MALGVVFGLVPTFGVTTVVSVTVALRLRLNVAAMRLAAHLMSAFQLLLLLIPLLRAGARLMGESHQVAHLSLRSLRRLIYQEGWGAAGRLLWLLVAIPVVIMLYFGLRVVFRRMLARQATDAPPAD